MKKLAVLALLCLLLVGCSQKKSLKDNIVGTWVSVSKDGTPGSFVYRADGTGSIKAGILTIPFEWTVEDESHIRLHNKAMTTETTLVKVSFDNDKMTQVSKNETANFTRAVTTP